MVGSPASRAGSQWVMLGVGPVIAVFAGVMGGQLSYGDEGVVLGVNHVSLARVG